MRRADRLFQIVQHFRGGRLVTAQKLGQWLEVSERTIYRDIADLQLTGVPIDGEAGVGYIMREGFDLPPLMFTRDEIVALVAGARMVRAFGGATMARAAEEALIKIGAILPDSEKDRIARTEIHTPMWVLSDADRAAIDLIERAVETAGAQARLPRRSGPRHCPRGAAARPVVLGQGLDPGGLVRDAWRFPRLPHRPYRQRGLHRPQVQAGERQAAGRFLPDDGARRRGLSRSRAGAEYCITQPAAAASCPTDTPGYFSSPRLMFRRQTPDFGSRGSDLAKRAIAYSASSIPASLPSCELELTAIYYTPSYVC